jgi:arsenite-transporting ATPase
VLDEEKLKWVFVGGKGGVGKTTTSCSLAVQLATVKRSVLLISTDPAHNLSDAFSQKFSGEPTKVNGFDNLWAMEIDPKVDMGEVDLAFLGENTSAAVRGQQGLIAELMGSVPGIDEAMSFSQLVKQVNSMEFETVVFDTAPTGHTLRLLSFPALLDKGLAKLMELRSRLSGVMDQVKTLVPGLDTNEDDLVAKLEQTKATIDVVNAQFKDPAITTFVCVCIPEFLSLYETERLVQELANFEIDTHNVVVNQLLFPAADDPCKMCRARERIQRKYLDQILDLYDDFHVVQLPLMPGEVRGPDAIREFSKMLTTPFDPKESSSSSC